MQTHTNLSNQPISACRWGGRVASDRLRATQRFSEGFSGLDRTADRYSLLLLVKRAGKAAGFSLRMVQLLEYYLAFTRDVDWEEGRPIVYQSLSRTALDLGVSERQIQKLEAALFQAGAIGWNDSGNHKRYGKRCSDTGRIVFAYGVDLSPLAALRERLEELLAEKQAYEEAWLGTKRQISELRRRYRGLVSEWREREEQAAVGPFEERYETIAVQIRTHLDLNTLHTLLASHESLVEDLCQAMSLTGVDEEEGAGTTTAGTRETDRGSSSSEPRVAHYKYSNLRNNPCSSRDGAGFQESVAEGPAIPDQRPNPGRGSAMEHVTLGMAVEAASDRLSFYLPNDPSWGDLVEAAYRVRGPLGVSQESWGEACRVLGRNGAAVCLLVADRAALREADPVRSPPAYFRAMVRRAEAGELRLARSLFGLLDRGDPAGHSSGH